MTMRGPTATSTSRIPAGTTGGRRSGSRSQFKADSAASNIFDSRRQAEPRPRKTPLMAAFSRLRPAVPVSAHPIDVRGAAYAVTAAAAKLGQVDQAASWRQRSPRRAEPAQHALQRRPRRGKPRHCPRAAAGHALRQRPRGRPPGVPAASPDHIREGSAESLKKRKRGRRRISFWGPFLGLVPNRRHASRAAISMAPNATPQPDSNDRSPPGRRSDDLRELERTNAGVGQHLEWSRNPTTSVAQRTSGPSHAERGTPKD